MNNAYLAYLYQHQKENRNSTNNQKALVELFELYLLYGILEVNTSWLLRVRKKQQQHRISFWIFLKYIHNYDFFSLDFWMEIK